MKRDNLAHNVRERLKRLPYPYDSHYGVVPLPPPESDVSVSSVLTRLTAAHAAISEVDTLAARLSDPYLISRILARQEAISSSSIEGTNSTLDELLEVEESNEAGRSEARQVRDYAIILEKVLPEVQLTRHAIFDLDLILRLHAELMREDVDYRDVPGQLRSVVVWIGGRDIAYSTWNPPPPEDVPACLAHNIDYMRNEGMQSMHQSLVMRMAIAHTHFEAVHPFRDGNGRVGRLLLPMMMAAEGLTPLFLSPYIDANKARYYDALREAQQRLDWSAMVGFVSDAVTGTVAELMSTRQALQELAAIWKERRRFRKGSAALRAIELLQHYPVVTINRLADRLGVSFPQAADAVSQLERTGILRERTGYSRNRIYAADEALAIMNRPFGEEPLLPNGTVSTDMAGTEDVGGK
jgi:Fic family protein